MMEPIIQTIVTQMNAQFEEDCLKVVNSYGFNVNKERLMQALTDARKFYDEGYRDGKRDSVEVVRCKDCKHGEIDDPDFPYHYYCHMGHMWNDKFHFCADGEMKDGDR